MSQNFDSSFVMRSMFIAFLAIVFLALSAGVEYGALATSSSSSSSSSGGASTTPSGGTQIQNVLCNAVNQLTGGIGRAISTIIIISTAFMLFLGKITWGLGIMIAIAMGLLFGAGSVVNLLSGNSSITC